MNALDRLNDLFATDRAGDIIGMILIAIVAYGYALFLIDVFG